MKIPIQIIIKYSEKTDNLIYREKIRKDIEEYKKKIEVDKIRKMLNGDIDNYEKIDANILAQMSYAELNTLFYTGEDLKPHP
jgi:hypothetical protein